MSAQTDISRVSKNPKNTTTDKSSRFHFLSSESPIPAQIRDGDELKRFFSHYKNVFVPYAGWSSHTSHSLLAFLMSLGDLSPTEAAVLGSMKKAIFGGKINIVKKVDSVFNIETSTDVSDNDKLEFYNFVKGINFVGIDEQGKNLVDFSTSLWDFYKKAGFCAIELVHSNVGGQVVSKAYLHHPLTTMFVLTGIGEQRYMAISPYWSIDYLNRNEPKVVPLYPAYVEQNGVRRTIMFLSTGNQPWYGFPENISTIFHRYAEFQQSEYVTKQTANKFMGEVFIEVEDGEGSPINANDGKDDVKELRDLLNSNHTNRSNNPSSFVVSARPAGAKQAYIFQFQPNMQADWYKNMSDWTRDAIISVYSWSRKMMGFSEASGMSTNVFLDEFKVKDVSVIQPEQQKIGSFVNGIIEECARQQQRDDLLDYSIEYSSPYKKLLDDNNSSGGNTQ